jgi:hypothetical protein
MQFSSSPMIAPLASGEVGSSIQAAMSSNTAPWPKSCNSR